MCSRLSTRASAPFTTKALAAVFLVIAASANLLAFETPQDAKDEAEPVWHSAGVRFNQDVRPILADRCFHCHGPDEAGRQADLRLDKPNDSNASGWDSVVSEQWDESELWRRIVSADPDEQMPPPDSHKKQLSESERKMVAEWLKAGAPDEQFWSFAPVQAHAPPSASSPELEKWASSPIDRFVARKFAEQGVSPTKEASRRTLIRRLSLDLTGLPPTLTEIDAFVNDDSATAYRDLVDRLLSSKRYGEHMAKYWLDLVRFADTNGIHHDHFRELTPYRDWVIRSFNDNLPFNKFAVAQIAGDLLPNPTKDELIASGFNRLHLVIDRGTALPEESHTRNVVDRVTAVGTAFMGLTVGCAVCHDHKYDPITQRDFYQLYAFFNNIDAAPETPGRGIHEPALRFPTAEQTAAIEDLDARLSELKSLIKTEKARLAAEQTSKDADNEKGEQKTEGDSTTSEALKEYEAKVKSLTAQKRNIEQAVLTTLIMRERADPRPAFILTRGAYDQPGEQVERGTPSFLPPLKSRGSLPDRLDLARWLIAPEHPLMARVTVNRLWQQIFGVGLVRTSEDFGAQGEVPSHPGLLDYLATEFVTSGWDVKEMMRRIVLSRTYRQSSVATLDAYKQDPANRLLARGSRYRLDAEVIRDQCLFTAGLLNEEMYGRSVKPPQPPDLWKSVSMVSSSTYEFKADTGEDIYRRSLYTFWKRALPPPQMTIFDAPTREACIARRERTNTPLQALVLMNEQLNFEAAVHLATLLLADQANDTDSAIDSAMQRITGRLPSSDERAALYRAYDHLLAHYRDSSDAAEQVLAAHPPAAHAVPKDRQPVVAALSLVINGIYNLDITKTRQ